MHIQKQLSVTLGSTSAFEVRTYLSESPEYAIAKSNAGEIGVTWNLGPGRPSGFPHTYGHQQWFILPPPLADMVSACSVLFDEQ